MVTNPTTTRPELTVFERTFGPCHLAADARAPGAARQWAARLDDPRARHPQLGLVVSELVTNAVVHTTCPELTVSVSVGEGTTRLEVSDCDPSPPRLLEGLVQGRPAGMGMRVVDAVTDAWGVERRTSGKTVWAEFRAA